LPVGGELLAARFGARSPTDQRLSELRAGRLGVAVNRADAPGPSAIMGELLRQELSATSW
jgi:hypothetical protein